MQHMKNKDKDMDAKVPRISLDYFFMSEQDKKAVEKCRLSIHINLATQTVETIERDMSEAYVWLIT